MHTYSGSSSCIFFGGAGQRNHALLHPAREVTGYEDPVRSEEKGPAATGPPQEKRQGNISLGKPRILIGNSI